MPGRAGYDVVAEEHGGDVVDEELLNRFPHQKMRFDLWGLRSYSSSGFLHREYSGKLLSSKQTNSSVEALANLQGDGKPCYVILHGPLLQSGVGSVLLLVFIIRLGKCFLSDD